MRFLLMISLLFSIAVNSQGQTKTDSVKRYTLIISPRLNSAGYFPFTGAVLNHNANFDFTVAFEKNGYGFFLFQSFDLVDNASYINYFQPAAFKKFPVGNNLKIGVYFGYLFSQTNSFSDKGESDYFAALSQHWDINKKLRLENTMLFGDLTIQPKLINRLLLIYRVKKITLNFYLHERVIFETNDYSTSAAIGLDLPKLRIADKLSAQPGITYQHYLTKNKPGYALNDGLLLSLAFPIDLSKN
jgi:hypothetical protein